MLDAKVSILIAAMEDSKSGSDTLDLFVHSIKSDNAPYKFSVWNPAVYQEQHIKGLPTNYLFAGEKVSHPTSSIRTTANPHSLPTNLLTLMDPEVKKKGKTTEQKSKETHRAQGETLEDTPENMHPLPTHCSSHQQHAHEQELMLLISDTQDQSSILQQALAGLSSSECHRANIQLSKLGEQDFWMANWKPEQFLCNQQAGVLEEDQEPQENAAGSVEGMQGVEEGPLGNEQAVVATKSADTTKAPNDTEISSPAINSSDTAGITPATTTLEGGLHCDPAAPKSCFQH
ncbi:hypothetical protein GYMLUDRAFT_52988 [Collybiopsis luxurians FD-317 M1]|nr:hypothetical protein GYMLUDRAFT_52988 [Collybiopsis luxurians FD-317 M1]